jgi:hypothetical protein
MAQLQAQQQQQQMATKWTGGRGRGYRSNPYYYGGNDQQYVQTGNRPQHAGGQASAGYAYMDGGSQMMGQQMGQQGQFSGQYAQKQATPQAGGFYQVLQQTGGYYPPPQLVRGPRPPTRANAECFHCGVMGHFSRDGACLQPDIDAYQARKIQQMAAGAAQTPGAAAAGSQPQITYVAPGAGDRTGSG